MLETLALICYRQPITRGEIEDVRGVALSPNIIRTLLDRGWIREVGVKEVPGRPSLFGTTHQLLDDLNLRTLDDLPSLPEIKDPQQLETALARLGEQLHEAHALTAPDDETGEALPAVHGEDAGASRATESTEDAAAPQDDVAHGEDAPLHDAGAVVPESAPDDGVVDAEESDADERDADEDERH